MLSIVLLQLLSAGMAALALGTLFCVVVCDCISMVAPWYYCHCRCCDLQKRCRELLKLAATILIAGEVAKLQAVHHRSLTANLLHT